MRLRRETQPRTGTVILHLPPATGAASGNTLCGVEAWGMEGIWGARCCGGEETVIEDDMGEPDCPQCLAIVKHIFRLYERKRRTRKQHTPPAQSPEGGREEE